MSRRRTTSARRLAAAGLVGFLALTAAGCGGGDAGGDTEVIDITIENGKVSPSGERVQVGVGDPVDLKVTADQAGTLHLHSEPEQELEFPKGTKTFEIQIDRPGVVEVEMHDPAVTVVQLEVR